MSGVISQSIGEADTDEAVNAAGRRDQESGHADGLAAVGETAPSIGASITREAIEALATQEGKAVLQTISALQAGAALLNDDEATLDALCAIKRQVMAEHGL